MATLPKIWCYGNYSCGYGINCLAVAVGSMVIYYSYSTIIAYQEPTDGCVVSENVWSVTTGKHLNWIEDNKKARVKHDKFEEMLKSALIRNGLTVKG